MDKIKKGIIALFIGASAIYLLLTQLYPYHLAHKAQFTLPGGWPTEPWALTLLLTLLGGTIGGLLRWLGLKRWICYPITGTLMTLCALHACDIQGRWFHLPNRADEQILAIDTEAHRNNWKRVQELTQDCAKSDFNVYYHNLSLAHQGQLADSLLHHSAPFEYALFYPIDETGNYMSISAAGEVWWFVKDLTMAEHAAMLGMIFSPHHTGVRPLKRLYEINMASGNDKSAAKFARILKAHDIELPLAEPMRTVRPHTDTLRLSFQYDLMLRSTLERNPANKPALEYLLCLDLLLKNLKDFRSDFERYGLPHNSRLFQEAMLILMSMAPELRDAWHDYIDADVYQEFCDFNAAMQQKRKSSQMQAFRSTYWYYFQFQKRAE